MRALVVGLATALVACATSPNPVTPPSAPSADPAPAAPNGPSDLPLAEPVATGDLDHDGIPDSADLCPTEAEDADGFQDENGCPEPDNDGDQILDASDKCPNVPETYNRVDDEDGCPDNGRVIMIGPCKLTIEDKIYFEKGAATLSADATSVLEAVVKTMNANPQLRVLEVQGHAARDERGPERLARARATAVLEYLVQHGVSRARLALAAHAADRPAKVKAPQSVLHFSRRVELSVREDKP